MPALTLFDALLLLLLVLACAAVLLGGRTGGAAPPAADALPPAADEPPLTADAAPQGVAAALEPAAVPAPVPAPALPALLPRVADLLLVDDSAVARAKLRRLFEGAGYRVELACDGVEALARLEHGRYAMMLTDLEMPRLDGVALITHCLGRPDTARMPILAVSGHENLASKFSECGDICGVHRKPWVDDILLSHVAALIGPPAVVPAAVAAAPALTEH